MKRTGPTNPLLRNLIVTLEVASRKNDAPIWKRVAELLSRPTRKRVEVNVGRLNKVVNDGETVVIPGVLLGHGILEKKVTVAVWRATRKAKEKVEAAGGRLISIEDLLKENPKGSNVRVIA